MKTVSMALPDDGQRAHFSTITQLVAQRARQIAHRVEVGGALLVDPAEQLRRAEALLAELFDERGQPVPVEIEQVDLVHVVQRE
jgi:hypothetical protein